MRASVGTESEWPSAARDLDSFVDCAAALFEGFSITGTLPDHPLLSESGNTNGNHSDPQQSPSNGADGSNGEGVGDGGGYGGNDPRGSPGARSPGVRSPGFPPCWLGPGGRRGSRRASTPVGASSARAARRGGGIVKEGDVKKTSGHRAAAAAADGGGSCDSGGASFVASPPRPRSRSVMAGGRRILGTNAVGGRGDACGRESPGKSRRRVFKKKDSNHSDAKVAMGGTAVAATNVNTTRVSADATNVESGSCADENEAGPRSLSPAPRRLPV